MFRLGCSDGSCWPGGIWWSFQMKVWTLMVQRNLMIPNYSMIPAIRWSPGIRWSLAIRWSPAIPWSPAPSKSLRWYLHHWWSCFLLPLPSQHQTRQHRPFSHWWQCPLVDRLLRTALIDSSKTSLCPWVVNEPHKIHHSSFVECSFYLHLLCWALNILDTAEKVIILSCLLCIQSQMLEKEM